MHGGEEIWECVCASIRSSGFFFFWLRDRCKLKKRPGEAPLAFLEGLSNLLVGGLPEMQRHALAVVRSCRSSKHMRSQ